MPVEVGPSRTVTSVTESADGTVPEGLDWDLWIGPAPKRPFNRILVQDAYNHSSWMDFSGGWTPGMAPHIARGVAVSIDGKIFRDSWGEALPPDAEIYLLPRIQGG